MTLYLKRRGAQRLTRSNAEFLIKGDVERLIQISHP